MACVLIKKAEYSVQVIELSDQAQRYFSSAGKKAPSTERDTYQRLSEKLLTRILIGFDLTE